MLTLKPSMVCPRCDGQGLVEKARVIATREELFFCGECDAMWLALDDIGTKPWLDLTTYLENQGVAVNPYALEILEEDTWLPPGRGFAKPVKPEDWIGRSEQVHDFTARGPFDRLAALLDRPKERAVLPMGHLLCFQPQAAQREIGKDGHPKRGGIVPPLDLPMRMAAGSRITFHAPIPFDVVIRRVTTIADVSAKTGRTGRLAFLTLRHEIFTGETLCVTDEMDIVFREKSGNAQPLPPGERREAQVSRTIDPTAALLFRYSALTYNAHRIHYDRDYATGEEGYPGLLVHGPLLATLLVDHFRRHRPHDRLATFHFRAQRPVYDLAPFTVNLVDTETGADVWAADGDGYVAMSGRIGVM
jgi:3-methylfumaryl-CoA hydratase